MTQTSDQRLSGDLGSLLLAVRRLQERVRDAVIASCERSALEELARVEDDQPQGDTIYAVDRVSEKLLFDLVEREVASVAPVVLIGEGLGAECTIPRGTPEPDAVWRVIVDPIDGTRPLMYQKRSAWVLTGVAPNRGAETSLRDVVVAVQTEIPLVKQHLSDSLWAVRGEGAHAERYNRLTGERSPLRLEPSKARTIRHGFAAIARFFPGAREELAAIDEQIVTDALGNAEEGKAHCFEDQYLSSGGQLYELMAGHDRFIADLRPLMEPLLRRRGRPLGICCHPYDVCTELIARQMGVIITDANGQVLSAPLDTSSNVAWVGYANGYIREEIEPLLQRALKQRGLLT